MYAQKQKNLHTQIYVNVNKVPSLNWIWILYFQDVHEVLFDVNSLNFFYSLLLTTVY